MKLLFNNTDFLVVIGANPFDNIPAVASCIKDYIVHLDMSVLRSCLLELNAIVEVDQVSEQSINDDDHLELSDNHVTKQLTIKSTGEGKLDVNDNDKLHKEWLNSFADVLRPSTIAYWNAKIASEV